MEYSELVYLSIFLLADKDSLVEELAVLPSIECIILHGHASRVVVVGAGCLFVNNLRGLKLVLIIVSIFVVQNRIESVLIVALVQSWPSYH